MPDFVTHAADGTPLDDIQVLAKQTTAASWIVQTNQPIPLSQFLGNDEVTL